IEEVIPVAARLTLPQLAQLGDQFQVVAPLDVLHDFALVPARGPAQQVDEAVRVARDEIDRPVAHALALHQRLDRLPPAAGPFEVTDLGTAQHPDAEVLLLRMDPAMLLE